MGEEAQVAVAKQRVIELTGGSCLNACHELITVRHFVPLQAVSRLIVRTGVVCDELASFHGVEIRACPEEELIAGFTRRGIDISGVADDVLKVIDTIDSLVNDWIASKTIVSLFPRRDGQNAQAICMKFLWNNSIMGIVIGKRGENIQRMRDDFHVSIYTVMTPAYTEAGDLERVLYIVGEENAIRLCVNHILTQLEPNDLPRREPVSIAVYQQMAMRSFPYPPYGAAAASAYTAPRPGYSMPMKPAYSVSTKPAYSVSMKPGYPMSTKPGYPMSTKPGYPMPPRPGYAPSPLSPSHHPPYSHWSNHPIQAYYPQPIYSYSVRPAPPTLSYRYIEGSAASGRLVISIPNDKSGNVLGRGGNVMSYIKASSSCRISLQQKEEITPEMTQRTVTIMGSEEGIKLAV